MNINTTRRPETTHKAARFHQKEVKVTRYLLESSEGLTKRANLLLLCVSCKLFGVLTLILLSHCIWQGMVSGSSPSSLPFFRLLPVKFTKIKITPILSLLLKKIQTCLSILKTQWLTHASLTVAAFLFYRSTFRHLFSLPRAHIVPLPYQITSVNPPPSLLGQRPRPQHPGLEKLAGPPDLLVPKTHLQ